MRGLPASELRTDDVAQMAYATESTPQSTINHNAVIELASDLQRMSPRHGRDPRKGAQKAGLLANRGPEIGRDHAKIAPPVQRRRRQNWSISKGICADADVFTRFLEMAVGGAGQRQRLA